MLVRISSVVILVMLALGVWGCKEQGKPEGTTRPAKGGIRYGGVFRVNEVGELSSLDPVQISDVTSAHIAENVYDNLLSFSENLELETELAQRWEVSESGRVYTYHIRTDVWFHDNVCFPGGKGRKLTAQDVVYSLQRVCDFRAGSKSFGFFQDKVVGATEYYASTKQALNEKLAEPKLRDVKGLRALDDSTVQITLLKPFGPFEHMVALTSMGIVAKEAVEYYGKEFRYHPVGTGPFIFSKWTPDQELELKRNPRYWKVDSVGNRLPYLDAVRFTFMKDEKMQLLEFAAGNLEESYRIPNEFFGDIVNEKKEPTGKWSKYKLFHVNATATQFYGFLNTNKIFSDKRIRQAFNYAINRNRISVYVLRNQSAGGAIHGLVPPSMPGYHTDSIVGYDYNPTKAKELLAQAGYPNGKGFPTVVLQLNSGGGRNVSIAEAIQGMLMENLNISVELQQVEFAQHLESIDHGKAAFFRLGWVADYPDPETFLNLYYSKLIPADGGPSPMNSTRYRNADFDVYFEKALAATDRQQRMMWYKKAEQTAMNDAPMMLLIYDEDYRFVQPYVRGYRNNAMDRRMYKYVWLDYSSSS